jgi:hypothetical protein
MSYSNARKAIESRFATVWGSATTIYYSNQPGSPKVTEAWVRLVINPAITQQRSLGLTPLYRTTGVIGIMLFVPTTVSNAARDTLLQNAVNVFQGKQFSSGTGEYVTCSDANITDNGVDGGWNHINITITYQHDEKKSNI